MAELDGLTGAECLVLDPLDALGQQLDQWQCKNAPGNNQDFTPS